MNRYLSLIPCLAAAQLHAQQDKPNVIVILVDDMGIGDNGTYGSTITPTPNIDRLAHEGLQLNSFYSAAPVSSPARTGLITGRCPIKYQINTFLDTKAANARVESVDYLDPAAPPWRTPSMTPDTPPATSASGTWAEGAT